MEAGNGQKLRLVAKTHAGLEQVLEEELRKLGAQRIEPLRRAVAFDGDKALMYRACYTLRTALRILYPVAGFTAVNDRKLYDQMRQLPWYNYLSPEKTFAVDAVISGKFFNHSQYVALKTKDAVADYFRDRQGQRPDVNTDKPDLRLHVHVNEDQINLYFDASGDSLHKRGYRIMTDKAPLNEVLAAGLIKLSGWNGREPFLDAMCGSGTIPIEAAMIAMHIPAGYFRSYFGFMGWNDFDPALWKSIRNQADSQISEAESPILASDNSNRAIDIAAKNLEHARLHKDIKLFRKNMENLLPPPGPGVLIINPPYGERLPESNLIALYKMIGNSLKRNFSGYKAWVISSDLQAIKHIGLKPFKKYTVFNGPLECRFVGFDVFGGSLSDHKKKTNQASAGTAENHPKE
ncbi:MAG: class I SAM-dependent RNA methyltransferase [Bacteroidetes bacterium]|nr:class I SAM-dependent RNA methyltransferase [Bacteroidota bacterium]